MQYRLGTIIRSLSQSESDLNLLTQGGGGRLIGLHLIYRNSVSYSRLEYKSSANDN